MRLREIQHQPRALSILRRALSSGRMHHAYLFEGPQGVGKALTAQALAARLLCESAGTNDLDACGQCRSCRLLRAGNHPDFHLIRRGLHKRHPDRSVRARKGLFLSIDVVRHFLIEPAANAPSLGKRRVFVVLDAERMNDAAQNALLKTLEEPPGAACLILVTSSALRLLPTIRSRCQRVEFDLLPTDFVHERLVADGVSNDEARLLARLAQGRLGVAVQWRAIGLLDALDEVRELFEREAFEQPPQFASRIVEIATALAEGSPPDDEDLQAQANESARGSRRGAASSGKIETDRLRDTLKLVLMLVAAILRDRLLLRAGAQDLRWLPEPSRGGSGEPDLLEVSQQAIDAVFTCEMMLDRNVAPQLACERLAIALRGHASSV